MKDYHRSRSRKFCSSEKDSGLDSIRTLDFCDTAQYSTLPIELISQLEAGHRVGLLWNTERIKIKNKTISYPWTSCDPPYWRAKVSPWAS